MKIQKIFSNEYEYNDERLYSVLMDEKELRLFSELEQREFGFDTRVKVMKEIPVFKPKPSDIEDGEIYQHALRFELPKLSGTHYIGVNNKTPFLLRLKRKMIAGRLKRSHNKAQLIQDPIQRNEAYTKALNKALVDSENSFHSSHRLTFLNQDPYGQIESRLWKSCFSGRISKDEKLKKLAEAALDSKKKRQRYAKVYRDYQRSGRVFNPKQFESMSDRADIPWQLRNTSDYLK